MMLKQMDKAGETYEALLKLKPNDVSAHLNLGIVAYNKKKMEDAESHFRKALELTDEKSERDQLQNAVSTVERALARKAGRL